MSLASFVTQVREDLQRLDDYGLATEVDISEEIRLSSQAVLRATVQLVDTTELHIRLFLVVKQGTLQYRSVKLTIERNRNS